MIEIFFLILGAFYFFLITSFFVGILNIKKQKPEGQHLSTQSDWKPTISVLIPARNEADTIIQTLKGLQRQTYPTDKLEVLIID
ncbi:MAG: glycosyltransferase, partial [Aliifodinibius sp.]|nr:glycosyltransferase [Fodinibius sp.]